MSASKKNFCLTLLVLTNSTVSGKLSGSTLNSHGLHKVDCRQSHTHLSHTCSPLICFSAFLRALVIIFVQSGSHLLSGQIVDWIIIAPNVSSSNPSCFQFSCFIFYFTPFICIAFGLMVTHFTNVTMIQILNLYPDLILYLNFSVI